MIEAFKTISYALGTFCLTAEFLMFTQTINPWDILEYFDQFIFTVVISSNIMVEVFFAFSGFLGTYRLL
jgi:hypothetical protein